MKRWYFRETYYWIDDKINIKIRFINVFLLNIDLQQIYSKNVVLINPKIIIQLIRTKPIRHRMPSPFQRGAGGIFICVFLFINFFNNSVFSQEIKKEAVYNYARKIVDTMASQSMHGRGYVNGGDSIAAQYIRNEYKKVGLKTFGDTYYQRFNFSINTFPDTLAFMFNFIYLDQKVLNFFNFTGYPGKNFLIDPSSFSIRSNFGLKVFDSTFCTTGKFKKFCKKTTGLDFILVDDRNVTNKNKQIYFNKIKDNATNSLGVIEFVKKLTWEQSQSVSNYLKIQIQADSFPYVHYTEAGGLGGIRITNKFIPDYPSQNVIGFIEGSVYPDSFIVFSAHYDHLGQMGADVYFPGANDNASGCAMLLNLAKYYSLPENKPKCSIVFMAFAAEEVGLLGSKYYTEHPLFPLKNIKFLFNMDIMGTGEEGITVVNGAIHKKEFDDLVKINTDNNFIKDIKKRGKASISDHYFFSEKGVKTFFIYTMGGIKAYHDIYDKAETLPLNEFEDLFKLIIKFGEDLQN